MLMPPMNAADHTRHGSASYVHLACKLHVCNKKPVNVISVQNCSTASHADAALDHLPRKLGLQVLSDCLEIDIKELRARALADTVRGEVLMNLCFESERSESRNAEHQLKRVRHVARELLEPDHRIAPTRSAQLGLPRTQIPMAFYSC